MRLLRSLILVLALGAALAVGRAALGQSTSGHAQVAAHDVSQAIQIELEVSSTLSLTPVSALDQRAREKAWSALGTSRSELDSAHGVYPPLGPDTNGADQLDQSAQHALLSHSTFGEVARDRVVALLAHALDLKYRAEALGEAEAAWEDARNSPTKEPAACKGFDPDPAAAGPSEETIAVDGCAHVTIGLVDETPGAKPLRGDWGAKGASGLTSGTCKPEHGTLECTPTPSASVDVVVLSSPLPAGTHLDLILRHAGGLPQTMHYVVPGKAPAPVLPTAKVVKLEVGLTCGGVVSAPIAVTNPTSTKPVIYVAQFKPHPYCGTNSEYLIDPATGKKLPDGVVIFPPNTTVYADEYECAQHPELDGCAGQGPDSQAFVFGITVTNPRP